MITRTVNAWDAIREEAVTVTVSQVAPIAGEDRDEYIVWLGHLVATILAQLPASALAAVEKAMAAHAG